MPQSGFTNGLLNAASKISRLSAYSIVYGALSAKSTFSHLKSLGKRPEIHFETPYDGQPILLLALYQKGTLRPDTIRLLHAAKAAGMYVLAINTLRLTAPNAFENLIDCYLERYNFGRDFGSYQAGFLHLFRCGHEHTCPRLLMLNDSVFFSERHMSGFLEQMLSSHAQVLGATENHEIEHHLGSFCIAVSGEILRHRDFKKYWQTYRNSDVRPTVIYRGEMGLSRILRRCVSASAQMRAQFSSAHFMGQLQTNDSLVDFAIQNARISGLTGWKRFSRQRVLHRFQALYQTDAFSKPDIGVKIEANTSAISEKLHLNSFEQISTAAKRHLAKCNQDVDQALRNTIISELVAVFMQGSQIHQNAAVLLRMGLPIVKLDGLYRGMFAIQDIQAISDQLNPDEREELQSILMERPYGGDTHIAWKRIAFMRGLI